jgi:hypothetical protein
MKSWPSIHEQRHDDANKRHQNHQRKQLSDSVKEKILNALAFCDSNHSGRTSLVGLIIVTHGYLTTHTNSACGHATP